MKNSLIIASLCLVPGLMHAAASSTKKSSRKERKRVKAARYLAAAMDTHGAQKAKLMKKGAALDRPTCMLYVAEEKLVNKGTQNISVKKWIKILERALLNIEASFDTQVGCARDLRILYGNLAEKAELQRSKKAARYRAKEQEYKDLQKIQQQENAEAPVVMPEAPAAFDPEKAYSPEEIGGLSYQQTVNALHAFILRDLV